MKKRMSAIALCLVMVSAFAVTGAVSAAGASNIRQYDMPYSTYDDDGNLIESTFGKLIVNVATGHVVVNVNPARAQKAYEQWGFDETFKDTAKQMIRETPPLVHVVVINGNEGVTLDLGVFATGNNGGNIVGEGTITDQTMLDTIKNWPADDDVIAATYFDFAYV